MDRLRDSLGIVAEAASVSGSDRSSTRSRTSVKAPLDVGRTKKSTRSRVRDLWSTLLHLLKTEWPTIKSLNLGVRSGTGVVEELLARKMCVCAAELHTLCTAAASAAEATDEVALLARALSPPELKELHILLDTTGHEALTDFINLQVYGTLNMDVHTALERSKRASAALTAEKAQPKGQGKGRFKTAMASLQKAGKASVLLAMASARRHSGTGLSPPFIDGQLRFASVLPDDHPLAQAGHLLMEEQAKSKAEKERLAREAMERPSSSKRLALLSRESDTPSDTPLASVRTEQARSAAQQRAQRPAPGMATHPHVEDVWRRSKSPVKYHDRDEMTRTSVLLDTNTTIPHRLNVTPPPGRGAHSRAGARHSRGHSHSKPAQPALVLPQPYAVSRSSSSSAVQAAVQAQQLPVQDADESAAVAEAEKPATQPAETAAVVSADAAGSTGPGGDVLQPQNQQAESGRSAGAL